MRVKNRHPAGRYDAGWSASHGRGISPGRRSESAANGANRLVLERSGVRLSPLLRSVGPATSAYSSATKIRSPVNFDCLIASSPCHARTPEHLSSDLDDYEKSRLRPPSWSRGAAWFYAPASIGFLSLLVCVSLACCKVFSPGFAPIQLSGLAGWLVFLLSFSGHRRDSDCIVVLD